MGRLQTKNNETRRREGLEDAKVSRFGCEISLLRARCSGVHRGPYVGNDRYRDGYLRMMDERDCLSHSIFVDTECTFIEVVHRTSVPAASPPNLPAIARDAES